MDDPRQYFVACAAIFNDQGQILLTKRNSPSNPETHNKWQLPGGSVEIGEHPAEAALREIKEETSLTIQLIFDRPFVYSHGFGRKGHVILLVYKAKYISGKLDISGDLGETKEAKWFRPEDVPHLKSLPETEKIVRDIALAKE